MLCNRRKIDFKLSQKLLHAARPIGNSLQRCCSCCCRRVRSRRTRLRCGWPLRCWYKVVLAAAWSLSMASIYWRSNTRVSMPYKVSITVIPWFTNTVCAWRSSKWRTMNIPRAAALCHLRTIFVLIPATTEDISFPATTASITLITVSWSWSA